MLLYYLEVYTSCETYRLARLDSIKQTGTLYVMDRKI